MADSKKTLYIIYNADGSLFGKLQYGYRKVTSRKEDEAPCAACDITHGGLSLNETPAWTAAKKKIEASPGVSVVQLHHNELPAELKAFTQSNSVSLPAVILGEADASYKMVMDKTELGQCKGDAEALVEGLKAKQII